MVKKYLMTIVWRLSQTGPILSLFFWGTALAGIFWPIIGDRPGSNLEGPFWYFLTDTLGIASERAFIIGFTLLFLLFAVIILLIGLVYDKTLKLWREQMDVMYERNPYVDDRLYRKERLQFQQFYLPLARALYKVSPDPELKEAIARVETWVETGKIEPKDRS
jgi:MFS family permease